MIHAVAIATMARRQSQRGTSHLPKFLHLEFILICAIIPLAAKVNAKPAFPYSSEPTIRVDLADHLKKFAIHANGKFELKYQIPVAGSSGFPIAKVSNSNLSFNFSENGIPCAILPNQKIRFLFPIEIESVNSTSISRTEDSTGTVHSNSTQEIHYPFVHRFMDSSIKFPDASGENFPGSFEIIPERDGTFTIVDIVPLETYLRGVVPNELVNNLSPDELQACMAQAIAARNFALYKMMNQDSSEFDVYSDTRDQVYSGMENYKTLADSAIALTSGMIVEYDGQPARCFFHSACGGCTESVQHVWQGQPALPYLGGVSDVDSSTGLPFCTASPNFYWTVTFTASQLNKLIKQNLVVANPMYAGRKIDPAVTSLEIIDRFNSSRVDTLKITAGDSSIYFVRGDRIRYFFKNNAGAILRSTMFRLEITWGRHHDIKNVVLRGQGSGHGVGMCQWGALGMSRLGYGYLQILSHYYPGTEVKKVY